MTFIGTNAPGDRICSLCGHPHLHNVPTLADFIGANERGERVEICLCTECGCLAFVARLYAGLQRHARRGPRRNRES